MSAIQPFSVTVHPFLSTVQGSCAYERGDGQCRNALVFIPGLSGGPHTSLALVDTILQALNNAKLGYPYSVWEFRMRSSYTGFGYSSLASDVEDIAALVEYLRGLSKEKIVLMGSSTRCQDCMEYMRVPTYNAPEVDAYIMQAPTSDRETAGMLMPRDFYKRTLEYAKDEIARGNEDGIMPRDFIHDIFDSPVTAYRWRSLIAKGGDDDYFSSDLDDATLAATFGRMNKPTLILPSENDEMVPYTVDKHALLQRWVQAASSRMVSQLSGLVPEADHTLSDAESQRWFADRVVRFLGSLHGAQAQSPNNEQGKLCVATT